MFRITIGLGDEPTEWETQKHPPRLGRRNKGFRSTSPESRASDEWVKTYRPTNLEMPTNLEIETHILELKNCSWTTQNYTTSPYYRLTPTMANHYKRLRVIRDNYQCYTDISIPLGRFAQLRSLLKLWGRRTLLVIYLTQWYKNRISARMVIPVFDFGTAWPRRLV